MANRQLDDVFGIRPVTRRHRDGSLKVRKSTKAMMAQYAAKEGNICLYVLGPDDTSVSKVGVSKHPYRRLMELHRWRGKETRMCYFAELSRSEGYTVETEFHRRCAEMGARVEGEWIAIPRAALTGILRRLIAELGFIAVREIGDTGDVRETVLDPTAIPGNLNPACGDFLTVDRHKRA